MDKKTRPSHQRVDGEIREIDERFSNGLMFPGDPEGSAGEVINCRCVLLQRARWAIDDETGNTKWDNENRKLVTIDSKNYQDFKDKYYEELNSMSRKASNEIVFNVFADTNTVSDGQNKEKKISGTKLELEQNTNKDNAINTDVISNDTNSSNSIEEVKKLTYNETVQIGVANGSVKLEMNKDKQNRHIKDSKEYIVGRSYMYGSLEDIRKLIAELQGTGEFVKDTKGNWTKKERVMADKMIGVVIDPSTGEETTTNSAMIHYSNTGTHIVPRKGE